MQADIEKGLIRQTDWDTRLRSGATIHAARLKYNTPRDVISLHLGYPDPRAFPATELAKITERILTGRGENALQYCEEQGDVDLRRTIASTYSTIRRRVTDRSIIITQGTTDALDMLPQFLATQNDVVLMETPTYLWAIRSFQLRDLRMIGVATDEQGVCIDQLRDSLKDLQTTGIKPKFLYIMPDFQNPSGHSMSLNRRVDLLSVASEFDLLLIEDNPYIELRYHGNRLPTLFELDDHDLVVSAGSFSKTIAPGIRLGWIAGADGLIERLVRMKQTGACTLLSEVVSSYLRTKHYHSHLDEARSMYRQKCDAMAESLVKYCSSDVEWEKPQGGFYFWLKVPDRVDIRRLCDEAALRGLLVLAGDDFSCDKTQLNALRLSFSYESEEGIVRGISVLGELLRKG